MVELQGGLAEQRRQYQEVLEDKLALDSEVAVYKRLIDAMDKRLRGGHLSNGSLHSLVENGLEEAEDKAEKIEGKVEKKDDTSSESEAEEDSGIFTKIKEKAADVFD